MGNEGRSGGPQGSKSTRSSEEPFRSAAPGLGVHQRGELFDGGEGGQVGGGAGVAHGSAVGVQAGLGEQAGEFGLAGVGRARPAAALPARPAVSAGTIGTPVPSTAMSSLSGSGAGGRGTTRRDRIAPAWAWVAAAAAAPSASAARSTRLVVTAIPARSPSRLLALANGAAAPARSTIVASPGDSDEPATPSSSSLGTTPCPQSAQW